MACQSIFSEKNNKNTYHSSCAELAQKRVKVNYTLLTSRSEMNHHIGIKNKICTKTRLTHLCRTSQKGTYANYLNPDYKTQNAAYCQGIHC